MCGKFNSIRKYDPSDFINDILIVKTRGCGRGKGTKVVWKESIFNFDEEELLEFITDRVFEIYSFLFEIEEEKREKEGKYEVEYEAEEEEEYEETLDDVLQAINKEIHKQYPRGFDNLFDASTALLRVHRNFKKNERDEDQEEYIEDEELFDLGDSRRKDYNEMSELDRELAIAEELDFEKKGQFARERARNVKNRKKR